MHTGGILVSKRKDKKTPLRNVFTENNWTKKSDLYKSGAAQTDGGV